MLVELKNIQKTYSTKNGVTFRALSNVSTSFDNTGLVFLVGASGSGKSTLLNVIGGLDTFDSGELMLAGRSVSTLKNAEIDSLRNTLMGFVFQEFNLIDTLSVYENVKLALDMQSGKAGDRVHRALREMGIDDKAKNKTKDLSGGQRQRVAIARALVKDPRIILADEPTGALDSATSEEVLGIFRELAKTRLVLVVTHDIDKAAQYGDRIIEMKDGRIYRDVRRRADGEVTELSGTQLVSDTLLLVEKDTSLADTDVEQLNEIMKHSGRKTFVNVETDPRKVKAMFPNLREAVDAGRSGSEQNEAEDSALVSDAFVPYKPRQEAKQEFFYKKSRLPNAQAARLGLNNLNHKKGRLILTIIVAFLAFALFGVAQSFTSYNVRAAISKTLEKEAYKSVALINADGSEIKSKLSDRDLADFSQKNPQVELALQYEYKFEPDTGTMQPMTLTKFSGVVEVDDVTKIGREILYGDSACRDYESVIISRFAAQSLIRNRVLSAVDLSAAVGTTVTLNEQNFRIAGIFESRDKDFGSFYDLKAVEKMNQALDTGEGQLYVKKGFMNNYIARQVAFSNSFKLRIDYEKQIVSNDMNPSVRVAFDNRSLYGDMMVSTQYVANGDGKIDAKNELFLGEYLLRSLGLTTDEQESMFKTVRALNEDASRRLVLYYENRPVYVSGDFRVEGLLTVTPESVQPNQYVTQGLILHPDVMATVYKNSIFPVQVYAGVSGADRLDRTFVDTAYDIGFRINAPFVSDYDNALAFLSILRYVLLGLAILFCLLVVLLLYNFISTSIRLTKKQIGILRALGAKKSDTFKIYAIEGFLVTLFSLGLAVVVLLAGAPMLNLLLSSVYGYYFALISIGPVVYVTMAALTLAVTVAAVFIPLRKFNRITPISAISGKE